MIITGSIVGVLLLDGFIFIRACGAKDLIENTNESCARLCVSVHALLGVDVWLRRTQQRACDQSTVTFS